MPHCDPNASVPRSCAEAFRQVGERLAGIEGKVDAIHEQTTKINGRLTEVSRQTGRHETRLALLDHDVARVIAGRSRWRDRLWKLCLAVGLVVLGYLLRS